MIVIETPDKGAAIAALERGNAAVNPLMAAAIRRGGEVVQKNVVRNAPGRMKRRNRTINKSQGVKSSARVELTGPAIPFAMGTQPHRIPEENFRTIADKPKRKQAMKSSDFTGGRGFASVVNHPGSRPHPFLNRAVEAAEPELLDLLTQSVLALQKEVVG